MILHTLTKTRQLYCSAFKVKLDCRLAQFLFIYYDYIYTFHSDKIRITLNKLFKGYGIKLAY